MPRAFAAARIEPWPFACKNSMTLSHAALPIARDQLIEGDRRKAQRYAAAAQRKLDERRLASDAAGPLTVAADSEKWLADREARGIRSIRADRGRFVNYILPHLGALRLDEVRPRAAARARHGAGTKTDVARRVPVHPTLGKILAAWKLSHWERIYGRAPTPMISCADAQPDDSRRERRGARVQGRPGGARAADRAGEHRDRGGHDLRSWFITTCQEHGAHRDLLRVATHTSKGDVVSGYTRAQWPALCAEVAKLRVSTLDGQILPLATGELREESLAKSSDPNGT